MSNSINCSDRLRWHCRYLRDHIFAVGGGEVNIPTFFVTVVTFAANILTFFEQKKKIYVLTICWKILKGLFSLVMIFV
jgi:hypothetical protein